MSTVAGLALGDEDLGPPERLHPLYLLTGLGQALKGVWGLAAGGAYFAAKGQWLAVAVMTLLLASLSFGALLLRWLKLEYRVGPHEIRIDSGFLSRRSRAIPFDRVTDVDIEQGPLQRLFGLARVQLETGASAAAKQEEGVLHTISLARAEALREHIRARRGLAARPPSSQAAAEAPALFAMDGKRVLTAGVFNFSLAVIAGLFGVTQTFGDVLGFDPFARSFWVDLFDRAQPVRDLLLAHQIIAVIGGSVILLVVGMGTGLVRTLLREYGFRLDRTESGFRRRRGLLTLTDVTIPARRIQAAILATGPVKRAFGWSVLKLQSLAQDGGKGDHVVAPLARQGEAAAIVATLGWPAAPRPDEWRKVSWAYVTTHLVVLFPIAAGAAGSAAAIGPSALLIGALAAALLIGLRYKSWRLTRYALANGMLFTEGGWWRHRREIIPLAKIQSLDLDENFWTRWFGICSIRLGIAGGRATGHVIPALTRDQAHRLRERIAG